MLFHLFDGAEGGKVGVDSLTEEVLIGRGVKKDESAKDGGNKGGDESRERDVVLERHGRELY
jgi:hypothetical protein